MEANESGKVDVIVETHDIADIVVRIEPTSSICQEHSFDPKDFADAHCVCHQGHGMTFIETRITTREV
jgi:hypothetical protein